MGRVTVIKEITVRFQTAVDIHYNQSQNETVVTVNACLKVA
jgi:hypothetical protein